MATIIKLRQTVTLADRTIVTEGTFEFDRDFLLTLMVQAAIDGFKAARGDDKQQPA